MGSSPDLLQVEGLTKRYPGPPPVGVFTDLSFGLGNHDSLAIVGPSGCGKTTLLLILAGLVEASAGAVFLEGERVRKPGRDRALVLQDYGLFYWKTVGQNILLGARIQGLAVAPEDLADLKRELGIEGLDHLYPHQVSGGQRQRVALARALLLHPRILLLDEPFSALDAITRERLQAHLLKVFGHKAFSFIIVTHGIEEAVALGRRILVMDGGGAGARLVENPGSEDPGYRKDPAYFRKVLEVRGLLEEGR
jgi:NitT/TauT family transport system ATP-binding protein